MRKVFPKGMLHRDTVAVALEGHQAHHQCLAEVELSVLAGFVGKKDEEGGALWDGASARTPGRWTHRRSSRAPLPAAGSVTLLRRAGFVLGQPPVYNGDEGAEHRPGPRLA